MAEDKPNDLAASNKATRLEAYSPWNIDFGDSRCRLMRLFGDADDRHVLFFEQSAPRASFAMTLAGSKLKSYKNASRVWIGMRGDAPMKRSEKHGRGDVATVGPALIFSSRTIQNAPDFENGELLSAGINPDSAAKVDRVVVKRGSKVLSFETGNMKDPFEALNSCTKQLMLDWGLDPEQHESYRPARILNENTVAKRIQARYPGKALQRGESGLFRMRVIVEPDGTASDCHLEQSTIAENLDSPACTIMMRVGEFDPATSADGTAIRSFYAVNITYLVN